MLVNGSLMNAPFDVSSVTFFFFKCLLSQLYSIEDVDEIIKKYTAAASLLGVVILGVIARLEPPRAVLKGDLVRRYLLSPIS